LWTLIEKKETVNIPLIKKYKGYSYDIIPGVESNYDRKSENLILTYKKPNK